MVNRSVIGQLDLFPVDDFKNSEVASGMSCGLSIVSTRTKVSPRITKETIDRVAVKLTDLPPLT